MKNIDLLKTLAVPLKETALRQGTAVSNLDGRLWDEVGADTGRFFGDEALVRARVFIETAYLVALSETGVIRKLSNKERETLLNLHLKINEKMYTRLRQIEFRLRHDVVAMTEILKMLLGKEKSLKDILAQGWVHWGLTSEDIDNLSHNLLLNSFLKEIYLPRAVIALTVLTNFSLQTKSIIIPGKTHLQAAIPTTLGKEISLFAIRLAEIFQKIKDFKLRGKLTGAVGTLAAHKNAFPDVNWRKFSKNFVESLGLEANLYTTQIEPRAKLLELFGLVQLINSILIDLSQDIRLLVGFDWLKQEVKTTEFGSSAMPQKVNPIDFENSQGNALLANWLFEGLTRQLPVSWLQRDLVDKTIFRNLGLPFGYSYISIVSSIKGLERISPNLPEIKKALDNDWGIIAEAIQTLLRAHGIASAYDTLKDATRGKKLNKTSYFDWMETLKISESLKNRLKKISPENYTGYAKETTVEIVRIVKKISQEIGKV